MTTFDSTKRSLPELLKDITSGKIQLPDFQRGWVWDDDHVQSLLVSIARSFPVGAVMLMETGGEVRFETRPVEGIDPSSVTKDPDQLILDGQQRLTSLTQAIGLPTPVDTRTAKGKEIKRHYYFDIRTALEGEDRLEDAVVAVDESRQKRSDFGRKVDLDLSTRQRECEQLYFPCDKLLSPNDWASDLFKYNQEAIGTYFEFQEKVLSAFSAYQLPVIELKKETSKEAVCLVFEKVNTGGVQLSVFELITASYAAEGYNLRDDWFGSDIRKVPSRKARLEQHELLKDVQSTDLLQAITLLHTRERKLKDLKGGRAGKQVRPVSAKRASVLDLPLEAYQRWADAVEKGFIEAARFLLKECFYSRRELPYATQLVPLAAVMTLLGNRWREPRIYHKLSRWYWSGVLGELYGGAVETRIALDVEELMRWFEDDTDLPRTVTDASFDPTRLESLRSRLSAAYKGINVLILREGAEDFFWKGDIQELDNQGVELDIHHIFPRAWCETKAIPPRVYDAIINKTPISFKANRMIGGDAPSAYLARLQNHEQVQLGDEEMNAILEGHRIPTEALRNDDFEVFYQQRKRRLLEIIEKAMGKKSLAGADEGMED
ncbi:GmrSD restriction endonuclease domain-containing protein [Salinicola halophyticus]|uniref:GmrSD restriction endonuclease domain-containing protein n=1 Tax=Salinicola halophyticus TaxID=1808881 RepID=UPI003F455D46